MRLFAAVIPPPGALAELAAAASPLHALPGARELRWTERAGWHLTLAFYGDVPDDVVPELSERLARAAARRKPLELRLESGGHFGDRALWAGVTGDTRELRRLAGAAGAAGRRAGLAVNEERSYHPHLTLARQGGHGSVRLAALASELRGFAGISWTAARLELVRSHLPGGGIPGLQPRYEVVGGWALGGSG
ncbi:RNA 2',3'-cyclic phosphodiesterase [Streptomyces sp. RB5]|uniref:RNA 2',3'-cyclic phosphodiesterase n=1 Tax=Streptomyces smaragdinus TaxID=2585196 RepID=A0A7K0CHP9_9ACTN|nr:RNA 2',3'-cyclic phosphodiesterase [Streptomyces smaragdinus]MQY13011.1 RNA 2',3'-cyclic phosphodiesterase [Streptomyces smaragdinus]